MIVSKEILEEPLSIRLLPRAVMSWPPAGLFLSKCLRWKGLGLFKIADQVLLIARLQVFDDRHALIVCQFASEDSVSAMAGKLIAFAFIESVAVPVIVPEFMPGVGIAWQCHVEREFAWRALVLEPDIDRVELQRTQAEPHGPLLHRRQEVPQGGDRSVMEVRSGGPYTCMGPGDVGQRSPPIVRVAGRPGIDLHDRGGEPLGCLDRWDRRSHKDSPEKSSPDHPSLEVHCMVGVCADGRYFDDAVVVHIVSLAELIGFLQGSRPMTAGA